MGVIDESLKEESYDDIQEKNNPIKVRPAGLVLQINIGLLLLFHKNKNHLMQNLLLTILIKQIIS